MRKWTVGTVNYKTSVYMKWQLKSLFRFNDPKDFQVVIIDNSRDDAEFRRLEELAAPYKEYNNIRLVKHTPVEISASGQHAEGLNLIIKQYADSEYVLLQDPDFFWVRQGILGWFESELRKGKIAVGAPYPNKVGLGHPYFPCLYGCAHRVADIKDLDCMADASEAAWNDSLAKYPVHLGWEFSYDVGYQIREKLSSPGNDSNFISFDQKVSWDLQRLIGVHSFEVITREYFYHGKLLAFHLFRGSFTGAVNADKADPQEIISQKWLEVRDAYGQFFYNALCNNGFIYKRFKLRIWAGIVAFFEFFLLLPFGLLYPLRFIPARRGSFMARVKHSYKVRIINRMKGNPAYMKLYWLMMRIAWTILRKKPAR